MSLLNVVVVFSLVISLALAASDPRAGYCHDKCDDFQELERNCIDESDCYKSGFNDDTFNCLQPCWAIGAPCRIACYDSFNYCNVQCRDSPYSCLDDCFQTRFQEVRPELPEQK